jgi:NADH-quinone oxidoreductase subunit J
MDAIFFWIFAAVTIAASVLVIGQRNSMYSVLLLIVSFGALAGLYVLLGAPFVAAIQIIIYAGAIMVLFVFVVMLLNASAEQGPKLREIQLLSGAGPRRFGAVLSLLLAVELWWAFRHMEPGALPASAGAAPATVYDIGLKLFTEYAFAFEATSVLILVAMVGAIVLAGRSSPHA